MLQFRDDNGVLWLDGSLTIRSADEFRLALADYLKASPRLVLNLSRVSEIDAAGWQLLFAAQHQAIRFGQPLQIAALSAEARHTGLLLGMPLQNLTRGDTGV